MADGRSTSRAATLSAIAMIGLGIVIGMAIGLLVLDNIGLGVGIGLAIGLGTAGVVWSLRRSS